MYCLGSVKRSFESENLYKKAILPWAVWDIMTGIGQEMAYIKQAEIFLVCLRLRPQRRTWKNTTTTNVRTHVTTRTNSSTTTCTRIWCLGRILYDIACNLPKRRTRTIRWCKVYTETPRDTVPNYMTRTGCCRARNRMRIDRQCRITIGHD